MKKRIIALIFLALVFNFYLISAQDEIQNTEQFEKDYEKLTQIGEKVPLADDGEIDKEKLIGYKSKAEERIDKIDAWLEENVGWMRYIFHMKPEVSWLFAANIYFILLFLVILVLNSEGLYIFLDKKTHHLIFGLALFIVFLVIKLYYGLAIIVNNFIVYLFNIFFPSIGWWALGIVGVAIIFLIAGIPVSSIITKSFKSYFEAKEKSKKEMEIATSTESFNAFMNQVKSSK